MNNEIWKDIPEHPHYQVSNLGNVKRVAYERKSKNGYGECVVKYTEKVLKPQNFGGHNNRYYAVRLDKKTVCIHRLVAEIFIPNPENKPCVDHIDNNPHNNSVDNLRWLSYKENSEAYYIQRKMEKENNE